MKGSDKLLIGLRAKTVSSETEAGFQKAGKVGYEALSEAIIKGALNERQIAPDSRPSFSTRSAGTELQKVNNAMAELYQLFNVFAQTESEQESYFPELESSVVVVVGTFEVTTDSARMIALCLLCDAWAGSKFSLR